MSHRGTHWVVRALSHYIEVSHYRMESTLLWGTCALLLVWNLNSEQTDGRTDRLLKDKQTVDVGRQTNRRLRARQRAQEFYETKHERSQVPENVQGRVMLGFCKSTLIDRLGLATSKVNMEYLKSSKNAKYHGVLL